ncbi:phage head-tail joining protein [Paenirhodobacter populi]|uniref:Uncharacterized protein n=1 Tax=Paenirhodobacter populi TaxID=2306993 RepID=A0A443JD71_9RHOB|nr:hypothetical protein [Sinirhodobacter populi]RWR18516.1 hypothetical protein D2T30_16125 [Sinirhodobacter populi]
MPSAEELISMRDALLRARASGTRSVTFSDGRKVEYMTGAELAAAITDLERRIAAAASARPGSVRFSTNKGF